MNRFIAVLSLVIASLAVASAVPSVADIESAVFTTTPNDSDEIIDLRQNKAFSDFCLQTRDRIMTEVGRRHNGLGNQFSRLVDQMRGSEQQVLIENTKEACRHMAKYEHDLEETFQKTKAQLAARNPALASVKLYDVKCTTSIRVLKYTSWCRGSDFL